MVADDQDGARGDIPLGAHRARCDGPRATVSFHACDDRPEPRSAHSGVPRHSLAKLILDRLLRRWLFGFDTYILITSLAPNVLFYCRIVAAAHGFAYYRSSQERASGP